MVDIIFVPNGSLVECVNITIIADFLVEDIEAFQFLISPNQLDDAVLVWSPSFATVIILDQEDGNY